MHLRSAWRVFWRGVHHAWDEAVEEFHFRPIVETPVTRQYRAEMIATFEENTERLRGICSRS